MRQLVKGKKGSMAVQSLAIALIDADNSSYLF